MLWNVWVWPVRAGVDWRQTVWRGAARPGKGRQVRMGWVSLGSEGYGSLGLVRARQVLFGESWRGAVSRGLARHVEAGMGRSGMIRFGAYW